MTSYPENWNETVIIEYDEGFPLLMPRWGYVVSAIVLFMIGFFGFFLNLMVILLMYKDRQLWTPLNMIVFNLVCSDFSVSVMGNPFTFISALFHRWVFGKTMCVLYGFFMALLGISSITTLTVLSFERYMMVTKPISSRHLSSKGAIISILFIWTYSLALTTPPLMGWGNYVSEAANISCSVNWHEQSMNTLTYILFLFAMGQIVPFAVITFSYVNIVLTMKKNSQRLGRVSRAENKVTAMVFVMIVAFTIAWTPYSVFALMEQFATEGIVSPGAGVIPALVAKSSICYDPLIYVGMNTQFRQSIKRLFGVHSHTEKGYDNTQMSHAHRLSCVNDTRCTSETNISNFKKQKDKMNNSAEDLSDFTYNDHGHHYNTRNSQLNTIQENKTNSEERSGETFCDEDSSSNKKCNVFGESCKLCTDAESVLRIVDSEVPDFSKTALIIQNDDECNKTRVNQSNVYGNQAFEDDSNQNAKKHNILKQSHSLDLSNITQENIKRRLSVETKYEKYFQPTRKGIFKNAIVTKFLVQDIKQSNDNFKSYLCKNDNLCNLDKNL